MVHTMQRRTTEKVRVAVTSHALKHLVCSTLISEADLTHLCLLEIVYMYNNTQLCIL